MSVVCPGIHTFTVFFCLIVLYIRLHACVCFRLSNFNRHSLAALAAAVSGSIHASFIGEDGIIL